MDAIAASAPAFSFGPSKINARGTQTIIEIRVVYAYRAVEGRSFTSAIAFLDQTARMLKVKFESIALMNPIQLKDSSAAEANATPIMIGNKESTTGMGVTVPKKMDEVTTLNTGSRVFTV